MRQQGLSPKNHNSGVYWLRYLRNGYYKNKPSVSYTSPLAVLVGIILAIIFIIVAFMG